MTVRGDESLPPEAVRAELERVVASPPFADSPRIAAFLTYVVEARLAGEDDRIQEYGIGLAVFERPESFDPRTDSIVRVEARRLRDKLARYYETAEAPGPVRIELPRRGYKPRFVAATKESTAPDRESPKPPAPSRLPWWIAGIAVAALAVSWLVPRSPSPDAQPGPIAFTLPPPEGMHHVPVYLGGGAVVSPDGRWIAFVAGVAGGEQELFLRQIGDPEPKRIEGSVGARWPFWSPDSQNVGFGTDDEIKTVGVGGGPVVVVGEATQYFGGAWGGVNGDVIVFGERRAGLRRLPASGGVAEPLTALSGSDLGHCWPEFLPDGERLSSSRGRTTGERWN